MRRYLWGALVGLLEQMPAAEGKAGRAPKSWTKRTFAGRGGAYLTRFTLYAAKPRPSARDGKPRSPWSVHINIFHRSDEDEETHSHPWPCGSVMLDGGYREERESSDAVRKVRYVLPGDVNVLPHGVFHRVDLLKERAITLFVTGEKLSSWTFLKRGSMVPWKEFVDAKGLEPHEEPGDEG